MARDRIRFGVSVALATPFFEDHKIDGALLGRHGTGLLSRGASSVTLYGTTGEGASIAASERATGIAALLDAGCPADRIILGVTAPALEDALAQIAGGLRLGITRFLVPPPFFFKGLGDRGLFDWYAALLAASDARAQIILYHIPQVTGVPLSRALVARLAAHAPDRLIGIKDSSGDWENAQALLADQALPVLVGDERLLHRAARLGGAGTISGMANLYPDRLKAVFERESEDAWLTEQVNRVIALPVLPALKALLAAESDTPGWRRLRPPLEPLSSQQLATLLEREADHA